MQQDSSKVPTRPQKGSRTFQQRSGTAPASSRIVPVFRGVHVRVTTPGPQRLKPNRLAFGNSHALATLAAALMTATPIKTTRNRLSTDERQRRVSLVRLSLVYKKLKVQDRRVEPIRNRKLVLKNYPGKRPHTSPYSVGGWEDNV